MVFGIELSLNNEKKPQRFCLKVLAIYYGDFAENKKKSDQSKP